MQSKRCSFSVDNVNIVEENSNSQFATLEVDVCRSGENSHNMPIPRSAIEKAASSVKGKPILAAFQFADTDFAGHEIDEQPVGFFVEEEPELVEKDYHGNPELYIRAKGKVWKRYFENAMEIFKRKSGKTDVSMEIDMLDFEEPDQGRDGVINLFSILGCTLLGVRPAIDGSEARVMTFSEIKDKYDEESQSGSDIERFANERKSKMAEVSYKINKTELKETPWGDVDKTAMRNKIMKAINKATLVKSVYALVEDGWQDAPSQHLKYPIMQLVGDTFYYNRYALSSALAYAKQENEQSVISKIEKLYRKFNLEDEGGDDKDMSKEKKNMEATEVLEESKCAEEEEVMQDEQVMQDEEQMADEEAMQDEEQMADSEETFESGDEEEVDKADENDEPNDEDAEGSDDRAEEFGEDEQMQDEEEMCNGKMSLDVNAYAGAMLEMLKAETDEQRDEAHKLGLSEDEKLNIVMNECYSIACELAELRKFKMDKLQADTEFAISQILAEVRQDLSQDKFDELEAQAKECSFDDVEMFRLKAQAFAYQNGIKKTNKRQDTHIRMGFDQDVEKKEKRNVFAEILNK